MNTCLRARRNLSDESDESDKSDESDGSDGSDRLVIKQNILRKIGKILSGHVGAGLRARPFGSHGQNTDKHGLTRIKHGLTRTDTDKTRTKHGQNMD